MTTKLGIYINEIKDGDYYHIVGNVVTIGPTRQYELEPTSRVTPNTIRNASDDSHGGLYLNHLQVSCQGDRRDASTSNGRLYGFDVRYRDVHAIDLRDAERMTKTLRMIRRRMTAMDEKFGRPTTYGQYVGRVANAIKADTILFQTSGPQHGWSYADNDHIREVVGDGVIRIDQMANRFHDEVIGKVTA